MTSTELKAVASFNDAEWKPIAKHALDAEGMELSVLEEWVEVIGQQGFGMEDMVTGVEWQVVDQDTMAYRIGGVFLVLVAWDYCGAPDGAGMTITDWQMGPGGAR